MSNKVHIDDNILYGCYLVKKTVLKISKNFELFCDWYDSHIENKGKPSSWLINVGKKIWTDCVTLDRLLSDLELHVEGSFIEDYRRQNQIIKKFLENAKLTHNFLQPGYLDELSKRT
jgi:hypothetical protein